MWFSDARPQMEKFPLCNLMSHERNACAYVCTCLFTGPFFPVDPCQSCCFTNLLQRYVYKTQKGTTVPNGLVISGFATASYEDYPEAKVIPKGVQK